MQVIKSDFGDKGMLELLVLFKWTPASMISASVLAFIGVQLAVTEKSVQVINESRAILGVLIGMVLDLLYTMALNLKRISTAFIFINISFYCISIR